MASYFSFELNKRLRQLHCLDSNYFRVFFQSKFGSLISSAFGKKSAYCAKLSQRHLFQFSSIKQKGNNINVSCKQANEWTHFFAFSIYMYVSPLALITHSFTTITNCLKFLECFFIHVFPRISVQKTWGWELSDPLGIFQLKLQAILWFYNSTR